MIQIHETGTEAELMAGMVARCPEIPEVFQRIRKEQVRRYAKREIREHEAALLYVLAKQFDFEGAHILEIGTCYGWSAAVIANAAPKAHITTMTPNPSHYESAVINLEWYPQIMVMKARSQDVLEAFAGPPLEMVFVDGDHKNVRLDLPWYSWLKLGGLMLHHDYTPKLPTARAGGCRWVYEALNEFAAKTHPPDVLVRNEHGEGMAGWYRRENETWPTTMPTSMS